MSRIPIYSINRLDKKIKMYEPDIIRIIVDHTQFTIDTRENEDLTELWKNILCNEDVQFTYFTCQFVDRILTVQLFHD